MKNTINKGVVHLVAALLCCFLSISFAQANSISDFIEFDKNIYAHTETNFRTNNAAQGTYSSTHKIALYKRKNVKLEFLAYSPLGNTQGNVLNGSDVARSTTNKDFTSLPEEVLHNIGLTKGQQAPLVPINFIKNGQVIFLRVADPFQNKNPNQVETAEVSLNVIRNSSTASLDPNVGLTLTSNIVLRMYETGANTGTFIGYVPFFSNSTTPSIIDLKDTIISAAYQQQDTGDEEIDYVKVNVDLGTQGRVFNSLTGELLNGINVTLVEGETGKPARVFAKDGVTPMSPTVTTGSEIDGDATDKGEYYFPYVNAGKYRVRIDNLPSSLVFPSTLTNEAASSLNIENVVLEEASYGRNFDLNISGALGVDIPVDSFGKITLSKISTKQYVGTGETIPYSLNLRNEEKRLVKNLILKDIPAQELRYIPGSLRINGNPSNNIIINPRTLEMLIMLPDLPAGNNLEINYSMRSTSNKKEEYVIRNAAQAFGDGGFISNLATADVLMRDDMLQTYGTIVGRVHFGTCKDGHQIDDDVVGLKGIRILQENGTQVTTDKNGRFSISAVDPGMHVVQLDKITLPKGVEVTQCLDNTRFSGTNFSQFVDVKGGFVHKVNFVVTGDKEKFRLKEEEKTVIIAPPTSGNANELDLNRLPEEMKLYNEVWLDKQNDNFELVYPNQHQHPDIKSLNFGVKHSSKYKVVPYINGQPVSQLDKAAVNTNKDDTIRITHYRGVDLNKDRNELVIYLKDNKNQTLGIIKYSINFNQQIYQAQYVEDKSTLQADGLSHPEIVFKLTDNKGSNIAAGTPVKVELSAPYSLENVTQFLELEELNQPQQNGGMHTIPTSGGGLLKVRLNPTTQSGQVKLKIYFDKVNYQEKTVWLSSQKREWVLVGLAQGTVGYNAISGNLEQAKNQDKLDQDLTGDNRVAFYTKGMIDKKWLMTLSYDENRAKDRQKMRFFNSIAPNQKFAVVGDMSQQTTDSPSQYPLYLKLEREHFYTLFGDYDTNLSDSTLLPYTRRLSGFQSVYSGENYSIQGFAAKDNQSFIRDDIRLDGTSGPYKLNGIDIVQGTDRVFIERRLRSNPNTILDTTYLDRYTDYDIDYQEGLISLRTTSMPFNFQNELVFLRVEFETYNNNQKKSTYGMRATKNFLNDDLIIGVTAIQDGDDRGGMANSRGYLTDARIRLTKNTTVKIEYGMTKGDRVGMANFGGNTNFNNNNSSNGNATGQNIEIEHRGDKFYGKAFYLKKENGFGFGTANPFDNNTQNYGVEMSYDFSQKHDSSHKETTLEENIRTGLGSFFKYNKISDNNGLGSLSITEIGLTKTTDNFKSYIGFREIMEEANIGLSSGDFSYDNNISQIMAGTEVDIIPNKASVFGHTEIPLKSNNDQPSFYGNKQTIGANINLLTNTNLKVAHRWTDLGTDKTEDTTATLGMSPAEGLNISTGSSRYALPNQDLYAFDTQATQQISLSPTWTANLGIKRHDAVGGKEGVYTQIDTVPDYALPSFLRDSNIQSPFSSSSQGYWEDYTSFGVGLIKTEEKWSLSTVSEYRSAQTENRYNFSLSWLGDVTDSLAVGFRGAYQWSKFKNGMTTDQFVSDLQDRMRYYGNGLNNTSVQRISLLRNSQIANLTGGMAYRPYDEKGPIILQRTELEQRKNGFKDDFFKIVNNIAVQDNITNKLELNGEYAVKYVTENYENFASSETVHIIGNQLRYDISPKWDVGVSAFMRYAQDIGTKNYSAGLSTGYSPAKNMYIQFGYNVIGFHDDDFSLQSYTAQGPFLKFNMKFDQESMKDNLAGFL